MIYKDFSDNDLVRLVEDAAKKHTILVERDSKVLMEMNNTLNWIITLLTVLMVTTINLFKHSPHKDLDTSLFCTSKIIFGMGILVLILHKIVLLSYEKIKFKYLNSLHTHELELKYDVKKFRSTLDGEAIFSIAEFINSFKEGKFIFLPGYDERPKNFCRMNKKIKLRGRILIASFYLSILLILINLSIFIYLILE